MNPHANVLKRVSAVRGVRGAMLVSAPDGLVVAESLMDDVDGRAVAALAAALTARLRRAAADQLLGRRPVEPHAALRRIHRVRHAEAVGPEVAAERERRLPVDRCGRAGRRVAERIGDHMGRRVGRPDPDRLVRPRPLR